MDTNPTTPPAVSNSKHVITLISYVFVFVALLVGAYLVYTQYLSVPQGPTADQLAWSRLNTSSENDFTSTGTDAVLATMDDIIQKGGISNETKNTILLEKAVMLLDGQASSTAAYKERYYQGGELLKQLYGLSESDGGTAGLRARAAARYLLFFNEPFFPPSAASFLPDKYAPQIKKEVLLASSTDSITTYSKPAMEAYMALATSTDVDLLKTDRTFLSNRIFLVASYVDTYYGKLTDAQKSYYKKVLADDLKAYPSTTSLVYTDRQHIIIVADFHYAYGYDVYVKRFGEGDGFSASQVATNYEKSRSNINVNRGFARTNAIFGQYTDAYYLNYLMGQSKTDVQKMSALASEMASYAKVENAGPFVGAQLSKLNGRNSDSPIRASLAKLAAQNKDFANYLAAINVTLK